MRSKILINKDSLSLFSSITEDFNPIHIDDNYAQKTRFKRCIAHGTYISGLIGAKIYNEFKNPILLKLNLNFKSPAYVGEEILIDFLDVKIISNNKKSFNLLVSNISGDIIIDGDCIISEPKNI